MPSPDPRERCLDLLASIYEALPSGADTPEPERDALDRQTGIAGSAVYGEITPTAATRLLTWLRPTSDDVFYDLGSGIGRLVLQAALTTDVGKAVGIELSAHRVAVARRATADTRAKIADSDRVERVEWRHEDLATSDVRDATLLYAGCFPPALGPVLARLARHCRSLRRLVTIRELDAESSRTLHQIGQLELEMTFARSVPAFVYGRR